MEELPSTPRTPSDCGLVSDEEDYLQFDQSYQVVGLNGDFRHYKYDYMTSVGAVRAIVLGDYVELHDGSHFHLVFGRSPRIVKNVYLKLSDLFDGYAEEERIITVVKDRSNARC